MIKPIEITDDQIKKGLELRITRLDQQRKKYELALEAFSENGSVKIAENDPEIANEANQIRGKFIAQQVAYLGLKDEFLGSRTMFDAHTDRNPTYKSIFETFSSQLTTYIRSKKPEIRRYIHKDAPNSKKYWYGLKEWFVGEDLKEKYKVKLFVKMEE